MAGISAKICIFRGLLMLVLAFGLHAGVAQAADLATDPRYIDTYNNDPNINTTCTQDSYIEQGRATGNYIASIGMAARDNTSDFDAIRDAQNTSNDVLDLWFCPIKVTTITNIIGMVSSMAAGIMAALYAAAIAAIQSMINSILAGICSYILAALTSLSNLFCLPDLNVKLRLPTFQFPAVTGAGSSCNLSLISVTGGPNIPQPPLNFNTTVPGTNWNSSVNVIRK